MGLLIVLPPQSHGWCCLLATICDRIMPTLLFNTHRIMPTREAHLRLWRPEFLVELDHILSTWLALFPSPPGAQTNGL